MADDPTYTLDQYVGDLRRITAETGDYGVLFDQISPLARNLALAKGAWLKPEHYETDSEKGYTAHLLHEEPDHSLAVFAVAWSPDRGTPPHDHGTWVVVAGVEGNERIIKYNRLDDGSRAGYAELEERCVFSTGAGDVICLRPKGIHVVWNDNDHVSVSLHTYGRHFDHTDRTAFNLETKTTMPLVVDVR